MSDGDVEMKQSLDDLVKRDKKLGRINNGRPLPGRGRGGRYTNQNGRNQARVNRPGQGINKQQRPQQADVEMKDNQVNAGGQENRNRRRRRRQALMGQNQNSNGANTQTFNQGQGNRRQQLNELRLNRRGRGRRAPFRGGASNVNDQGGNQVRNPNRLRKRNPQAPAVANQRQGQGNQQQTNNNQLAVNAVQGTLAQRKIKVRNIDARVVTGQDLKKLFSKCGPLISAAFDTNEFGAFIGTATLIYNRASSAARAIKDYNLAQIDNRTMKVEYAFAGQQQAGTNQGQQNQRQNQASGIRPNANRIRKTGRGRTLNVMGGRGGRQ